MTASDSAVPAAEPERNNEVEPDTADSAAPSVNNAEGDGPAGTLPPRPVLPVTELTEHPGNVREDLHLDDAFLASIAENGVLVPLRVTTAPDGAIYVIDGHRRLAAAAKAGLADVPIDYAVDRADDTAAQYLDMFNTNRHSLHLTPLEEAGALFAASASGASRTRIRKATGLPRDEVSNALKAGRLSETARLKSAACYGMNLEQYALLQEFDDDQDAVDRLLEAFNRSESGQHTAERIRADREARAEADKARTRYRDAGYQISTGRVPAGGMLLLSLSHDGEHLTPEAHEQCPGRGIVFQSWAPNDPIHYCADPAAHGHQSRLTARNEDTQNSAEPEQDEDSHPTLPEPQPEPDTASSHRFVVEGNRSWTAAATVRRSFLGTMFSRGTATRDMELFAVSQLLTMPAPLRSKLTSAPYTDLFAELTGSITPERLEKWTTGKLPMLPLALVVTCYEEQLGGDSGKLTWRETSSAPAAGRTQARTSGSWPGPATSCRPSSRPSPTASLTPARPQTRPPPSEITGKGRGRHR